MNLPRIAQMVHYTSYGTPGGEYPSECRAAIITHVNKEDPRLVSVTVFNPFGYFLNTCFFDESTYRGGTWHWADCPLEVGKEEVNGSN